jgi:hypothetical protein
LLLDYDTADHCVATLRHLAAVGYRMPLGAPERDCQEG